MVGIIADLSGLKWLPSISENIEEYSLHILFYFSGIIKNKTKKKYISFLNTAEKSA